MGEQGTTFSNSFVSFSQCCPSRATFLTGQYPHNHGVWDIRPPLGGYTKFNGTNTLTLWLQSAGYFTSHIGKYLNGYGVESPDQEVPPGWDHWQGLVDPTTYAMYDYTINDNGRLIRYGSAATDYQTDVLANRAAATVQEAVNADKPFSQASHPWLPTLR